MVKVTVTASAAGFLDAFIDYNQNGSFSDLQEQIFKSQPLVAGPNVLTFTVPAGATIGNTFARFRFSSAGGLGPSGQAPDGEVEDYEVTVGGPPWQNASNKYDVSGDGALSAIDALLLINFLNTYGNGTAIVLSNTGVFNIPGGGQIVPGVVNNIGHFFDVNGDGFAAPNDVLAVINQLNLASAGIEPAALPVTNLDASANAAPANAAPAVALANNTSSSGLPSSGSSVGIMSANISTTSGTVLPSVSLPVPNVPSSVATVKPVDLLLQGVPNSSQSQSNNFLGLADHKLVVLDTVHRRFTAGHEGKRIFRIARRLFRPVGLITGQRERSVRHATSARGLPGGRPTCCLRGASKIGINRAT